jgi:DNA-directed RNA polymerase subunit M/transcription elongation factor TFIIS
MSEEKQEEINAARMDMVISNDSNYLQKRQHVVDGEFTCPKCKSRKVRNNPKQIRSGDEPMTNFLSCVTCGNSWKK